MASSFATLLGAIYLSTSNNAATSAWSRSRAPISACIKRPSRAATNSLAFWGSAVNALAISVSGSNQAPAVSRRSGRRAAYRYNS